MQGIFLVILLVIIFAAIFVVSNKGEKKKTQEDLVWLDEGRKTKSFISHKFQMIGKPDAIKRNKSGKFTAVEYKSRRRNIYLSDIIQAKAAALVARDNKYNINEIRIETQTDHYTEALPNSDTVLFEQIEEYVILANKARNKENVPAFPSKFKCKFCSRRNACEEAI